jgi:hypothetical protein
MWGFCRLLALAAALLSVPPAPAHAQAQQIVEIPSRPGQSIRALLLRPPGGPAASRGSIILLAGGHGNLSIGKDGNIAWGKGIHVVRARAEFAKSGYSVLLPDIANDHKKGEEAIPDYRASVAHAMDIGALVAHMRKLSAPVYLVGTDRAAVSVANAAVRLSANDRPDAIVVTSGMLMHVSSKQPSAERLVPGLQRISLPTLLVAHARSGCRLAAPTQPERFQRQFLTGARKVEVRTIGGGVATAGDQCGAQTAHGFAGQDAELVRTVTDWLKTVGGP